MTLRFEISIKIISIDFRVYVNVSVKIILYLRDLNLIYFSIENVVRERTKYQMQEDNSS